MDAFPIFCSALKLEMEVVKQHNLCEVQNIKITGEQTNRTAIMAGTLLSQVFYM